MKKYIKLFGLIWGLARIMALTLIIIFNTGFYVGATRFIPESNQFIRIPEIAIGLITIPILSKLLIDELK